MPGANAASFTLDNGGAGPPTILSTVPYTTAAHDGAGFDRTTGDWVEYVKTSVDVRWYNVNPSTAALKYEGKITLPHNARAATFYRGFLVVLDVKTLYSYSMNVLVPTLVDSIDLTSFVSITDDLGTVIYTDPFTDWLHIGASPDGDFSGCAVKLKSTGIFDVNVVSAGTSIHWSDRTNCVYFLDGPLTETA
jgi:hypothetical protein